METSIALRPAASASRSSFSGQISCSHFRTNGSADGLKKCRKSVKKKCAIFFPKMAHFHGENGAVPATKNLEKNRARR